MGKCSFYLFSSKKWRTNNSTGNMYCEEHRIKLLLVNQISGNVSGLKINLLIKKKKRLLEMLLHRRINMFVFTL